MEIIARVDSILKAAEREEKRLEAAVRGAVADGTNQLQQELRLRTIASGLGARLARTWRRNVRPKVPSLSADGMVWSKAPHIITAFAHGATIRARQGTFLAIPLPSAGRGPGGTRITPERWERRTGRKLRFVPRRSGGALLVTDAGTGGFTGRGAARISRSTRRRARVTIPIFVLRPQVKLSKRLDLVRPTQRAIEAIPHYISQRLS